MQTTKHQQTKQQGFVLALALLLMLFIGVIVISSAQKTGVETRAAQSEAPIATMQAAAEEGLYQLRRALSEKIESGEWKEKSIGELHELVQDVNLNDLFDVIGIDHPSNYSGSDGYQDIYWWFKNEQGYFNPLPLDNTGDYDFFTLKVSVFVGDPDASPGPFMSASIKVEFNPPPPQSTPSEKIKELFGLDDDKAFSDLTASDLDKFYDDEYLNSLDASLFAPQKLAGGATLDPNTLSSDKINILVLDGKLNIQLSEQLAGKELIIVSNKVSEVGGSSDSGGKGKGGGSPHGGDDLNGIHMDGKKGAGAGGISGWILAPDAGVYTPPGTPHINMNVNVDTCKTGAHTDRCFESAGGSGFNGNFDVSDFTTNPDDSNDSSNGDSSNDPGGITVQDVDMDFDY